MSDFETVPVGTMEELKRVKAERDEAFAKGKQVFEDLRRVEAERDALVAEAEGGGSTMATETKFTSGPWKYNAKTREIGVVDTSDTQSYGMMMVVAYIDEYDHPEYAANSHLIAAAPELYEALDMLMDASGPGDSAQLMAEERENIIELLAKARGE